jgi:polyisoprenoid-binding protein YceI
MIKFRFNALFAMILAAGLFACSGARKNDTAEVAVETPTVAETASLADGMYVFEPGSSKLLWEASKFTGSHNGTIDVQSGSLSVSNGMITAGSIEIDLNTINAVDLAGDPDSKAKLEGHLKSADFFSVEVSPVAVFQILEVMNGGENGATHTIKGNLTIKNITNEVTFPAMVTPTEDGINAKAKMKLDRTKWEMMFRSGLEKWGDKTINDEFDVEFDLVAKKSEA